MRWRWDGAGEALRSPIPWVALSAALALTATGWIGLEDRRSEDAHAQFERNVSFEFFVLAKIVGFGFVVELEGLNK